MAGKKFRPWTKEEDQILRDQVAAGRTAEQIADSLPGRTKEGVRHRRVSLGIKGRPKAHNALIWENGDDDLLRQGAAEKWPMHKYLEMMPTRSKNAIYFRGRHLGLPPITIKYNETRTPEQIRERQERYRPKQWDEIMADWAERKCLSCGVMFRSWGKGNRLCNVHRNMSTGMD